MYDENNQEESGCPAYTGEPEADPVSGAAQLDMMAGEPRCDVEAAAAQDDGDAPAAEPAAAFNAEPEPEQAAEFAAAFEAALAAEPAADQAADPAAELAQGDDEAPRPARQVFPDHVYEQKSSYNYAPYANKWREPAYSHPADKDNDMYTPCICTDIPQSHKQHSDISGEGKTSRSKGRAGGFVRAACLFLACVICSGAAAYGVMEYRFRRGDFTIEKQVVLGNTSAQPNSIVLSPVSSNGSTMAGEDIYDMACSHVVGINTELSGFGGMFGSKDTSTIVSGSGFIISTDGYILTNYHVIETAALSNIPLKVYLKDGTQYEATVIGYESSNDFAVIKIEATGLTPAFIGDSSKIKVGQPVYAVGNPFGDLTYTMTQGIVSALDRIVTIDGKSINTFQFDAAVNSGNSGGPVYNSNGEVIGIVTAKLMSGSVEGIGFAIPIDDAIKIASELIEHGYITGRPLIGVSVESFNSGHAEYYDLVDGDEWITGAFVKVVNPDSAAEKAGIQIGDIIVKLEDVDIISNETLLVTLRKYKAGDTAHITVWRKGEEIELTITFDENLSAGQPPAPSSESSVTPAPDPWEPSGPRQPPVISPTP